MIKLLYTKLDGIEQSLNWTTDQPEINVLNNIVEHILTIISGVGGEDGVKLVSIKNK